MVSEMNYKSHAFKINFLDQNAHDRSVTVLGNSLKEAFVTFERNYALNKRVTIRSMMRMMAPNLQAVK